MELLLTVCWLSIRTIAIIGAIGFTGICMDEGSDTAMDNKEERTEKSV